MFFKNKHVIAAMIISPILAIMAYFAVDHYVAEVPHSAKKGNSYKMLVKPNCRWQSGKCDLVNNDVKFSIKGSVQNFGINNIYLVSSVGLTNVQLALTSKKDGISSPESMIATNDEKTNWKSKQFDILSTDYLQFAVKIGESYFYAQVPAIFIHKEQSF